MDGKVVLKCRLQRAYGASRRLYACIISQSLDAFRPLEDSVRWLGMQLMMGTKLAFKGIRRQNRAVPAVIHPLEFWILQRAFTSQDFSDASLSRTMTVVKGDWFDGWRMVMIEAISDGAQASSGLHDTCRATRPSHSRVFRLLTRMLRTLGGPS